MCRQPSALSPQPSALSPQPLVLDPALVVVLLLAARESDLFFEVRLLAPAAARRAGVFGPGRVPALVAAADFPLGVKSFEHEIDGRRHRRRRGAGRQAGPFG